MRLSLSSFSVMLVGQSLYSFEVRHAFTCLKFAICIIACSAVQGYQMCCFFAVPGSYARPSHFYRDCCQSQLMNYSELDLLSNSVFLVWALSHKFKCWLSGSLARLVFNKLILPLTTKSQ